MQQSNDIPAVDISAVAAREWREYVEPLLPIGERLVSLIKEPENDHLRQELYRAAFCALASGYLTMLNSDAEYPDFVPFTGQFLNLLGPNPDFIYEMAQVADDGIYKLSGYRGTVHMVIVQTAGGEFVPRGDGTNLGTTYDNYYLDDLTLGEDGAFEVILSQVRPEGYTGDWWKLAEGSTYVMIRQLSYDWPTEVDARFGIERLDRPAERPRPSAEKIAAGLRRLADWTESYVAISHRFCEAFAAKGLNEVHFIDFADDGGMPAQAYLEGMFDIGPDEAMILESEIPEQAKYWSFHLTDERWTAPDWINRQSILNGHTAVLDGDGRFRAVISPVDPGVPNWLDTQGFRRGIIQGRWHKCSSYPQPKLTIVPVSEVLQHLPQDTAKITPEERDAAIRRLRKGAQMRRRW